MKPSEQLDKILEHQNVQNARLERITVLLEGYLERLEEVEASLKPVQNHVALVNGIFRVLTSTVVVVGGLAGIARVLMAAGGK